MATIQILQLSAIKVMAINGSPIPSLIAIQLPAKWLTVVVFLLLLAIVIVSLLWYRREQELLKNLTDIITAPSEDLEEIGIVAHKSQEPKDTREAFISLIQRRRQELDRLNKLENYRRDYIGNVAHELKTPIFAIQGYIDAVLDDPEIDRETLQTFLSKASKNSARLAQIVSDLDTITKYESGFLTLNIDEFDLFNLCHEIAESMELQAKEKNISIQVVAMGEACIVLADRPRIAQVLTNLVYNSIRYGKQDGNTRIRLSSTLEKVIVEVADNGIGIPAEHQSRIFERFYRVDKHRNRATGGSGLGLSICKHIVEAHNETIGLISTDGAGSSFSFSLKLAPKDE
ncbi:MAG: sensor histidine kinase [Bacteroidota bacterium]|jgi:two-component system phosphate regulon sensor histidine kinase PhoR